MVLKMKSSEWWKSATIIIGLLIFAIVGYYIIRPSTCENAGNCGNNAESFTNSGGGGRDYSLDIKKQWTNIIKTAKGENFLVEMPNPGNTKYVINQTSSTTTKRRNGMGAESNSGDVPSSIDFPISPIRNAYFQIDLAIKNDSKETQNNWNNIVQVVQYRDENKSNMYIPNLKIYSIEQGTNNYDNQNIKWYYLQIIFKMPDDIETIESPFYLTIIMPSDATFQRFSILRINPIQNIYQSFPAYNNLILFVDSRIPESYNGNGTLWRNLINSNKSLQWSSKPFWSNEAFHFGTSNIRINGIPSTFITDGKSPEDVEFTLVWNYQQNEASPPSKYGRYVPFITFYGNENIALQVEIPKNPFFPIRVICGDATYISDIKYDSTQMNTYIVTYRNRELTIWIEGREYFNQEVRVPYMNSQQFEINKNYKLNGTMQYFIAYDISLPNTSIPFIMNSVRNYPSLYHELQSGKSVLNIFAANQNVPQSEEHMTSRAPSAIKCPKVLFDKNTAEYQIYIDQQNPYDQNAGKVGTYFSSPNKQEVLQKYLKNFVGCPVPDTLVSRPTTVNCPFRQNRGTNPCYQRECFNMNWNADELNPGELMTPACGQNIDNYCSSNYKKEPICNCWDPRYQQTPQCRKMRGLITGKVPKIPKVRSLYPVDENPEYPFWMKK